jgi:hypothetical protein
MTHDKKAVEVTTAACCAGTSLCHKQPCACSCRCARTTKAETGCRPTAAGTWNEIRHLAISISSERAAADAHAHRHARVEIERNPSEHGMRRRGRESVEKVDVGEGERVLGVADGEHDRASAAVAPARVTGSNA